MKTLATMLFSALFISACSSTPPKVKEPSGDWIKINNPTYYEQPKSIQQGTK